MTSERSWLQVDAGGRVECPRRGETVELSRCLECNWSLNLDRSVGTPTQRCSAVDPVPDGRDAGLAVRHVD